MKLSTRSRYGLRAMLNIARSGNGPVSSDAIAGCESISKKYLDGILGKLRSAGLIKSVRGQGGGYKLARHPRDITAVEVIEALEGGVCFTRCVKEPGSCEKAETCAARAFWSLVSGATTELMRGITIEKLARWNPGDALGVNDEDL
ncbi:MAG: Rrf2 family transcriptional regulator [Candidatus Krumholzibacteriota bacterium]|nr:Rrf2 family transcriptional regulator [Candidatus Krumholzibacteriota bacterium]